MSSSLNAPNYSSHGFVLSIFPIVNCLGIQGFIAPDTPLGRAQFRMGISQIISIIVIIIGVIMINSSKDSVELKSAEEGDVKPNDDSKDDADDVKPNDDSKDDADDAKPNDNPHPIPPLPIGTAMKALVPVIMRGYASSWGHIFLIGGSAVLGLTTFMSMLTGMTIGAQGNWGRAK
tara:strand:- start:342 stop:869 length:528 start_codon:yes stop_codon:yes gene_type:complete